MATAKQISDVMKLLGKRKSKRKKAASIENGKNGGRPITNHDPASIARRKQYADSKRLSASQK